MRRSCTARGLLVGFLAVTSTALLVTTLVLGLMGMVGATTWTGSIGVALLAMWLVSLSGPRRAARKRPN
jgi:hypothetical protein